MVQQSSSSSLHQQLILLPSLYLQLFQQLVVVSNRCLQRLQELLLCLQLLCHSTRPPGGMKTVKESRIFKMLRPCSRLRVLRLAHVGEARASRVCRLHPEHSTLAVAIHSLFKLHLVHLEYFSDFCLLHNIYYSYIIPIIKNFDDFLAQLAMILNLEFSHAGLEYGEVVWILTFPNLLWIWNFSFAGRGGWFTVELAVVCWPSCASRQLI